MSTQPEPAPGENRTAVQYLRPLRDLAALILVAGPAVLLFVAVLRLIPSGDGDQFSTRAQQSFGLFINLTSIGLPLLAVLLATVIRPEHPKAKLITTVVLAQYAVMAFFGILFGFLIALVGIVSWDVRLAFEEFLVRSAWLAVFGVAAFAVFQIWRNLYYTPRPQPVPGMYGQPANQQFGPPSGAPQSAAGPYGTPAPPYGAPAQYGQPDQQHHDQQRHHDQQQHDQQHEQSGRQSYDQPTWNQPGVVQPPAPYAGPPAPYTGAPAAQPPGPFAPEPGHPQGAAPYSSSSYAPSAYQPFDAPPYAAPTSGARGATYGAAPGYGRPADPTQPVPPAELDRTQMFDQERYGPDEHGQYGR